MPSRRYADGPSLMRRSRDSADRSRESHCKSSIYQLRYISPVILRMEVAFNMYGLLVARIVRSRFAAMSRRDLRPVLRYFADAALFWSGGDHALPGEYRWKAAIGQRVGRLRGLVGIEVQC